MWIYLPLLITEAPSFLIQNTIEKTQKQSGSYSKHNGNHSWDVDLGKATGGE